MRCLAKPMAKVVRCPPLSKAARGSKAGARASCGSPVTSRQDPVANGRADAGSPTLERDDSGCSMTGRRTAIITAMALAVVAALGAVSRAPAAPLLPLGSIPIAEVTGRITDLALDYANRRLFVLEDDPGAVAAIDLTTGTATQMLKGLPAARGLAHEPPNGQLYVALGNGKVAVLEGVPLRRTAILTIGPNLTKPCYDAGTTRVYLGYARRAIAAIDTAHNRILPSIYLDGDPGPLAFESLGHACSSPRSERAAFSSPIAQQTGRSAAGARGITGEWPPLPWTRRLGF